MGKNLTYPAVLLVAILGGLALGLFALTDLSTGEVLGVIGLLAGVGGGAAVASAGQTGTSDRLDAIHAETQAQTPVLATVARRVNGELDNRIASAMEEAAEMGAARAIAAFREGRMK